MLRPIGDTFVMRSERKEVKMKKYRLEIKPAIEPKERHQIEKILQKLGYNVWAGGTYVDMSSCDISFKKED